MRSVVAEDMQGSSVGLASPIPALWRGRGTAEVHICLLLAVWRGGKGGAPRRVGAFKASGIILKIKIKGNRVLKPGLEP